jgi:FKBP-type peptidyl-prolyl cis-trans isomerase
MKKGEVARLTMTGDYAYGPTGLYATLFSTSYERARTHHDVVCVCVCVGCVVCCSPAWGIGPNATLMFEMEVISIQ